MPHAVVGTGGASRDQRALLRIGLRT